MLGPADKARYTETALSDAATVPVTICRQDLRGPCGTAFDHSAAGAGRPPPAMRATVRVEGSIPRYRIRTAHPTACEQDLGACVDKDVALPRSCQASFSRFRVEGVSARLSSTAPAAFREPAFDGSPPVDRGGRAMGAYAALPPLVFTVQL